MSQYIGQPDKIFEGEDLYQEQFKAYIVRPNIAVAVKEVSIESSKLGKLQNAVIYDVPGFDSPTGMHLEQTKERMKEADAIMLIGSAKAHLQKLGIVDGDDCVKRIEENEAYRNAWAYGDGIKYAYEKLVEYNKTERFPVIKKKIQRNNEELFALFKELKEKYADGGPGIDYSVLLTEITSLKSRAKKTIQKELEELRFEIVKKYKDDCVLSKRLREEISKLFEIEEKYTITDEDIHNAELKIDDTSGSINVEKVEEIIREAKFSKIYGDFSESAFAVAQKDHARYYARIIDCFEHALGRNRKSGNYDKLHQAVTQFVEKCKKNTEDEFIYQSVIERFVRDVVEVLIRRPYSSEARLNKFVDEAEVFSGLVMFYQSGNENEGYKRQFFGNTDVRSYDDVCEFFRVDLEILEKFLIHASIPAIRLEKPFVAKEVQSINRLLKIIDSTDVDHLIDINAKLMLPGIYESFDMAIENSIANKAAVAEVEKILKTLEIK